jgi:hypothetical protein
MKYTGRTPYDRGHRTFTGRAVEELPQSLSDPALPPSNRVRAYGKT